MGDYESRMFDLELEISELIKSINRRDPALCNYNWRDLTYDYDLGYINYIFQNTNDEEMLDIVKDLICKEHRRLLMEGKIQPHIDEVTGYPDDEFDRSLDLYTNNRKNVLVARREEQEARERYAKKLGKKEVITRNCAEETTTGEDSITEETASKMDWVRLTDRFDLEKIKEVVKNTGKNNEEKRIVVKAILTALYSIDKLYNIPYSVDKLILHLYQEYGGQRRDLYPTNLKKNKSYFDKPNIPKCLTTPKAKQTLDCLRKAGFLLEDWQPNGLSGAECGLVAKAICEHLNIQNVWKVFGLVWNKKSETLRRYYNTAFDQKKSLAFQDKLKEALA